MGTTEEHTAKDTRQGCWQHAGGAAIDSSRFPTEPAADSPHVLREDRGRPGAAPVGRFDAVPGGPGIVAKREAFVQLTVI